MRTHATRTRAVGALALILVVGACSGQSNSPHVADGAAARSPHLHVQAHDGDQGVEGDEGVGDDVGPYRGPVVDPRTLAVPAAPLPATAPSVGGAWNFVGPKPIANLRSFVSTPPASWGAASGRITSLAVDPTNANVVFGGSAGGGVWKSIDGGVNWAPAGNSDQAASLAIGALGIDATGQQILAGTGEINSSDSQPGQGILKSSNGGASWSLVGTGFAGKHIGGIAFDSTTSGSSAKVYLASDAGFFKSANGGATWSQVAGLAAKLHVFPGDTASQATYEVVQDPVAKTHFYIAAADQCVTESGDIVMYDTATSTFTNVYDAATKNSPAGRIALGMGSDGRLWAFTANCSGAPLDMAWKSSAGLAWTTITGNITPNLLPINNKGRGQGWYDLVIAVDPTNSSHIVVGGVGLASSLNAGNSFNDITDAFLSTGVVHVDMHAVAFTSANHFYTGSDGGVWKTANLGTSWTNLNNTLAITQYYGGTANDLSHLVGGAQDNSVSGYVLGGSLPAFKHYTSVGDGAAAAMDTTAGSNVIYGEGQNGYINKVSTVNPAPGVLASPCDHLTPPSAACGDKQNFIAPFVMDPDNPQRLLSGTTRLWESKANNRYTGGTPAGSAGWTNISGPMIVPTAICNNDALQAIQPGGIGESGVIFTVSTCGSVNRTLDDGKTWSNITGNLPPYSAKKLVGFWPWASAVAFNPWDTNEAWVTLSAVNVGHVWHTNNANAGAGTTWTDISGGVPNASVNSVLVDPRTPTTIYIGTAAGALVCTTCGGTGASPNWARLGTGLPNVWVTKITYTRDFSHIVAWTHGRGVWTLMVSDPTAQFTTFSLPTGSLANEIAAGPNGLWYDMRGTDQIGQINTPAGNERSFSVTTGSAPFSIAASPDGNVWFAEFVGNHVGRVTPTGAVLEFPALFNTPDGITAGPDGNMWISVLTSTHVNAFNLSGHPLIGAIVTGKPRGVVTGADGNIWVAETNVGKVARITMAGVVTEFNVPGGGQILITRGPDGNVWFSEANGVIGRVTPAGVVTEFTIGGAPTGLATGPDGKLWVAAGASIIRVNADGTVNKTYPVPGGEQAYAITAGPDGAMWFTMRGAADAIGRFNIAKA